MIETSNPYAPPQASASPPVPPPPPMELPKLGPGWSLAVRVSTLIMLLIAGLVVGGLVYFAIVWLTEPVAPRG